jgi:hypothetical protein
MVRVSTYVIVLLAVALARAEGPPPDPSRGETYDGIEHHSSAGEKALWVPRILLAPVRLLLTAFAVPVHHLLDWDEVNHAHEMVFAAFSSPDGSIGVRPTFQYSVSFTPVVGLSFFDHKLLGRGTDFNVIAMTGGIHIFYGEVNARPTPSDRALEVGVRTSYNMRDDQLFAGIGYATDNQKTQARPSRYSIYAVDGGGTLTWLARRGTTIDFDTLFGFRRFGNGVQIGGDKPIDEVYCVRGINGLCIPGTVDPVQVPGFVRGTQFFRAAANARFDSRDNWYRPSSGALIEAGVDWTHGLGFDDSQYFRLHGGLSAVMDLWERARVLIVRFEVNDVVQVGYTPVPFTELVVIGGPDTFRGFRAGQFRNYSSMFWGLEYRWPVWMWMDATLFGEYGGVFGPNFQGFNFNRMVPDVGAGIRVRSSDAFFARAQVAYGWGDGWQAFFSVNTGF